MVILPVQETLNRLEAVIPIFKEFEETYNLVVNLPSAKRNTMNLEDILPSKKKKGFLDSLNDIAENGLDGFLVEKAYDATVGKVKEATVGKAMRKKLGAVIDQGNANIVANNAEIDRQIALAQQKCDAIRRQYSALDMSWYPPDYQFYNAALYFRKALLNGMCQTLGEAVRLYDEQLYRDQVLANQQKQINLAFQQCILQGQTIAAIHDEGYATRQTIQAEGAATRQTIQAEGASTRGTIQAEGQAARQQSERQFKDLRHDFRNLFGR